MDGPPEVRTPSYGLRREVPQFQLGIQRGEDPRRKSSHRRHLEGVSSA